MNTPQAPHSAKPSGKSNSPAAPGGALGSDGSAYKWRSARKRPGAATPTPGLALRPRQNFAVRDPAARGEPGGVGACSPTASREPKAGRLRRAASDPSQAVLAAFALMALTLVVFAAGMELTAAALPLLGGGSQDARGYLFAAGGLGAIGLSYLFLAGFSEAQDTRNDVGAMIVCSLIAGAAACALLAPLERRAANLLALSVFIAGGATGGMWAFAKAFGRPSAAPIHILACSAFGFSAAFSLAFAGLVPGRDAVICGAAASFGAGLSAYFAQRLIETGKRGSAAAAAIAVSALLMALSACFSLLIRLAEAQSKRDRG